MVQWKEIYDQMGKIERCSQGPTEDPNVSECPRGRREAKLSFPWWCSQLKLKSISKHNRYENRYS